MPDASPAPIDEAITAIAEALASIEGPLPPKKRAVVEAAVLIFAEKGYDATSTREIAVRAGVAEATIFRHFPTKKELLLRLVRPVLTQVIVRAARDQFDSIAEEVGGDLEKAVRLTLIQRLGYARRYAPLLRIILQELPFQPDLQALFFSQIPEGLGNARDLFAREVEAGRLGNRDPAQVMRWVASLFAGYFIASTYFGVAQDDEAEITAFVETLFAGLRAGAPD
jgi:AcrR family transcriptional regulator